MKVLLIEDNPGDARLVQEMLREAGGDFSIDVAERLASGLEFLASQNIDVVLLDLNLPDSHGLGTFTRLQTQFPHLPVVIKTGSRDEALGIHAVQLGAQDYLVKGQVDSELLRRSIVYAVGRKKAEEAILQAKEEWELTFSSVPDLMAILDTQHRIVRVNKAMADRLGLTPEQCIGQHCYEAVHGLPNPPDFCPHTLTCRDGKEHTTDVHEPRLGGDFQVSTTPIYDRRGVITGSIHVARDITERKRAEQIKDEFIGMVSHELKTPLTVVMGALHTATASGITEKESQELLQDAIEGTNALAGIIENLLELSRSQANRLELRTEHADLDQIARNVLQQLHSKSTLHRLKVDLPEGLPAIVADPVRVERILFNLVENAIKYSPKGGEVRISVCQKGDDLVVCVSDRGPGISPDNQKKLFQSFEQLGVNSRGAIHGVGLGLRVCRTLVEAHSGRIWVESELDKGSSFYFTLPIKGTPVK